MTQTIEASPTKLRNGDWGARVCGAVSKGDIVTITTRAGRSWDAVITKVLWTADGVAICATESVNRMPRNAPIGCSRCRYIPGRRTAQIWESCDHCGTEPVYR